MTKQEYAWNLYLMRRRLEQILEDMSVHVTGDYDLVKRMEKAAADMNAAKRKLEEV